ncbi:MAG: FecR family protein [Niabella sp.]
MEEHSDALSSFLNEEDWQAFLSAYDTKEHKIETGINDESIFFMQEPKRKLRGKIIGISIAVAASVMIIFGILLFFYSQKDKSTGQDYELFVNRGFDSSSFMLKDGTKVHLASNSSLRFEVTQNNERLATLDGGAFFAVKKDSVRKFIVKAQEVYSTVLGTSFSVQADKSDSLIKVSLFTGRLSAQYISDSIYKKKYILNPGDVYYYSKNTQQDRVESFQIPQKISKPRKKESTVDEVTKLDSPRNQWYMFNNQPLNEVFDQLSNIYGVNISYNKGDLSGLTFIGKIDKTDTLEQVLEYLSRLNGLKLSKEDKSYIISK